MAPPVLNPNYKLRNLVAYNLAASISVSFAVFLSVTQPFYLTEVLGINSDDVGKSVGKLSVVDELAAMCVAPLIGALNDRINGYAWNSIKFPSGPRAMMLAGFVAFSATFVGHGSIAQRMFPDLYFFRSLFAIAMSTVMSIAMVMLHEANNSDFQLKNVVPRWKAGAAAEPIDDEALDPQTRNQGKLSALLGICTGVGALVALVFSTLPFSLTGDPEGDPTSKSISTAYTIVAAVALVLAAYVYSTGYDCVQQRRLAGQDPEQDAPDSSYWQLMRQAVQASAHNRTLQLAYFGGAVARASSMVNASFTPLMVYKYFSSVGICGQAARGEGGAGGDCREGLMFVGMLTGIASTVGLLSIPAWSYVVDSTRLGCRFALSLSAAVGAAGSLGLCIAGWSSVPYNPQNASCFFLISLIGASQMGLIVSSMTLLSRAGRTLEDVEHRVVGSISGLYSLSGGLGILFIATVGGFWSDAWVFAPFLVFGGINVGLLCAARWHSGA